LYTLGLESNVSYIQIYYIDYEISVIIIIKIWTYCGGYGGRLLWMGTGFGCRLAGMETMFVSYNIVLRGFLYAAQHVVVKHIVKHNTIIFVVF